MYHSLTLIETDKLKNDIFEKGYSFILPSFR